MAFFTSLFITVLSGGRDHPVYLYVRVVYQPCKESFYNCTVLSVSVFDDRSVPDGNVYPVQAGGYAEIKLIRLVLSLYIWDLAAGLSVFMFCGFVKSIPLEIEEAAMIDGCTPLQTFFGIVMPIMKPTCITVAILQTMWIWNDYLLPYLVLDMTKYKTIPIAVQYLKGGYGSVDMGAMMGVLVLAIIPIIVFYLACQKYIIEGVVAGAVKG